MLALPALVLVSVLLASPRQGPPEPLQPRTYVSPSGTWSVNVDPTKRYGEGPGNYRAQRAGEDAWSARLPFTLHEAVLDDAGYLAGYA